MDRATCFKHLYNKDSTFYHTSTQIHVFMLYNILLCCILLFKVPIVIYIFMTAIGPNFVQCQCPPGYQGNGIGPNGCTLNPSGCGSSCQNGQCLVGYCDVIKVLN